MADVIVPTGLSTVAPDGTNDLGMFFDSTDANRPKKNTLKEIIIAGLNATDSDELAEGSTNLYMTALERGKLAGLPADAEKNQVNSVQGQQGDILVTQDMVPDGVNFKQTQENYTTVEKARADTAWAHSQNITTNPHNVTYAQTGLPNVLNEEQLSKTAGDFSKLLIKPDTQFHWADLFVVQDSSDADSIKAFTNDTAVKRRSGKMKTWAVSTNYQFYPTVNGDISDWVYYSGELYRCLFTHQSTNFAAELVLGYWEQITDNSGGGGGGNGQVKVTGADLIDDYLALKMTSADGTIAYTVINAGGDEDLDLSVNLSNFTGDVNFNGGDVTFTDNAITYDSNFVLIGCTGATALDMTDAIDPTATKAVIDLYYDNTGAVPGDTWAKTVEIVVDTDINVDDVLNAHSGVIRCHWNTGTGDIEVSLTSGAGSATADVCQYSGGVVISDNGSITYNDGTIVQNASTTEYYDANSQTYNYGYSYFEELDVTNLNITNLGADATVWNVVINTLASVGAAAGDFILDQYAAANTTVTLPSAAGNEGKQIVIKKNNSSGFQTVLTPQALEYVNGGDSGGNINLENTAIRLISDGVDTRHAV